MDTCTASIHENFHNGVCVDKLFYIYAHIQSLLSNNNIISIIIIAMMYA